jgi:hypothetical protein
MNQLTIPEARTIARHKGYGGNVTDSLYALALITLDSNSPVITYEPIDWNEDDGSDTAFDMVWEERVEKLQVAENKLAKWSNR